MLCEDIDYLLDDLLLAGQSNEEIFKHTVVSLNAGLQMLKTLLSSCEDSLDEDSSILNELKKFLVRLFCHECVGDDLELWIVSRLHESQISLVVCWKVVVELGIKLLPHLLREAKSA